jgi:hypothetical protein
MTTALRPVSALAAVELAAVIAAAALAIVPLPPALVESGYATTFYPLLQRSLTPLSNRVPVAVLDALLIGLGAAVAVALIRAIRQSWRWRSVGPLARTAAHLAAVGAGLYIVFLVLWGFNYRRVTMPERLVLDRATPSSEDVVRLGLQAVDAMNSLYGAAHRAPQSDDEWRNMDLRNAFAVVQRELSESPPAVPGRLKHSMLGPYFRWTGVDGMINPFALEVLVNPDLLPFERFFVAAHEWGHLAGYADEAEANFVGWLTCIRASPAAQYSGWFYLYWQISGEVNGAERGRMNGALGAGPRADVNAVIARLRRGEVPALQSASWKVYDQYLKANRVEAGIRSYGAVVTLILRARFENGWIPVRRAPAFPSPGR